MTETAAAKSQRGKERRWRNDGPPPRLLARWQRAVLWAAWLGTVAVIWSYTEYESLQWPEVGAIAGAVAVTVWMCKRPAGKPKVVLDVPEKLVGEFESRLNWPWVVVSTGVTLIGLAFCVRLVHDIYTGFATWRDVLADTAAFFAEWITERTSNGLEGDVTHTRMYVLVVIFPIGAIMLWLNLIPLTWRGCRFRVDPDGSVRVLRDGLWTRLNPREYTRITADGVTIDFRSDDGANRLSPDVSLPQWRVFSREQDTRVADAVLAAAFRQRVEAAGLTVDPPAVDGAARRSWTATRE